MDARETVVLAALDQLAAERIPAQVAARLHMDCAIGVRESFTSCPVAEWLLARTGVRVLIGPYHWAVDDDAAFDAQEAWHRLPKVVSRFVVGFDAEMYPALDDAVPA